MDYAALSGGYSFVWLAVLYVVGACVKKFRFLSALSRRACLLLYGGCVLVGFFYKIGAEMLKTWLSGTPQYCDHLMNYFLPSVFLGTLFLLRLFSDLKPRRFVTGLVHFFAPAAFGVYLFHTAPFTEPRRRIFKLLCIIFILEQIFHRHDRRFLRIGYVSYPVFRSCLARAAF